MANNKISQGQLPCSISEITFNRVDSTYVVKQKKVFIRWIENVVIQEKKQLGEISFNFCSDTYLKKMNRKHLQHNYFTDIITFDFCEDETISGDIYISVDRVRENAKTEKCTFSSEMSRVIIHGVLHLCGYGDKTIEEQYRMRRTEDKYLSLLLKQLPCFT